MARQHRHFWAALAVWALGFVAQPAYALCETTVPAGTTMVVPIGAPGGGTAMIPVNLISLCMGGAGSQLRIDDAAGRAVSLSATDNQLSSGGLINHSYAQHPGTRLDLYGTTNLTLPVFTDVFSIRADSWDSQGMDVINHGTFQQAGSGTLMFSGTANLVNEVGATYNMSDYTNIRLSGSLVNKGTFSNDGGGWIAGGGSLTNATTGVFTGNNIQPSAYGSLSVSNSGAFVVDAGRWAQVASFTNHAGSLTVNGTMEILGGALSLLGGTLSGTGTINGDVFVGGGPGTPGTAEFNPGNSPGTMTINGNFELLPGGVLNLEIIPDGSGGFLFDKLVVGGSAYLNGQVNFLVDPSIGDGWGVLSGIRFFDCLTPGPCSVGNGSEFTWNVLGRPGSLLSYDSNGFYIDYLAPVPEPETWTMMLAGLGLVGWMTRRRKLGK